VRGGASLRGDLPGPALPRPTREERCATTPPPRPQPLLAPASPHPLDGYGHSTVHLEVRACTIIQTEEIEEFACVLDLLVLEEAIRREMFLIGKEQFACALAWLSRSCGLLRFNSRLIQLRICFRLIQPSPFLFASVGSGVFSRCVSAG
jgi:hypothetical protein